jgi:hypothetical protein
LIVVEDPSSISSLAISSSPFPLLVVSSVSEEILSIINSCSSGSPSKLFIVISLSIPDVMFNVGLVISSS